MKEERGRERGKERKEKRQKRRKRSQDFPFLPESKDHCFFLDEYTHMTFLGDKVVCNNEVKIMARVKPISLFVFLRIGT